MVSSKNFYSIIIICLHTVIGFPVTNNYKPYQTTIFINFWDETW